MKSIKVSDAKEHIEVVLQKHLPLFLWGPPGIGKSAIVKQIAKEKKWDLIDLRLSMLNPVDLRGLPVVDRDNGTADWFPPEFLPKDGQGILFLDELNKAPNSVMAAAYQLILDRRVGNYKLPPKWRVIAAGNRESDKSQVNKLPAALANRFIHLDIEADVKGWLRWAMKNKIDPRIQSFIELKTNLLATLPKRDEKAYPTPRSWEFAGSLLQLYTDATDARIMIEGTVGEGAASEFYSWLPTYAAIPSAIEILEGKSNEIPTRPDVLTALVSALVTHVEANTLDRFLEYTFQLSGEFAVTAVKEAVMAGWDKDLQKLDRWEEWSEKFYDLIDD